MTVVETPFFLRKAAGLLTDEERAQMVEFIATHPEDGDIMPESGGVRKLRWAAKGKGKSGGVRVIYYFYNDTFPIFLLTLYTKSQKANLTKAERNDLKSLVPMLMISYRKGRQR